MSNSHRGEGLCIVTWTSTDVREIWTPKLTWSDYHGQRPRVTCPISTALHNHLKRLVCQSWRERPLYYSATTHTRTGQRSPAGESLRIHWTSNYPRDGYKNGGKWLQTCSRNAVPTSFVLSRPAVAIGLRQIICYSSCKFANPRIINVLLSLLCIKSLHHSTETEPQLPLANRFPNPKPYDTLVR
jgi:hypothetical protein